MANVEKALHKIDGNHGGWQVGVASIVVKTGNQIKKSTYGS